MGKVIITAADEPGAPDVGRTGVAAARGVASRGLIAGDDRPLILTEHTLGGDASLRYDRPHTGHVIYVWKGAIAHDTAYLSAGSAVVVEHGAEAELRGTGEGAVLLDFCAAECRDRRGGGHVHARPAEAAPARRIPGEQKALHLYADAMCPTCELWLHKSVFLGGPDNGVRPHWHNEDEIIFITEGRMLLGARALGAGSAIAVDEGSVYSFMADEAGLAFINFRASDPIYKTRGEDKQVIEISEGAFFRNLV